MAFAFTKDSDGPAGDMKVVGGTFTNGGSDSGGDIYTGLQKVIGMHLQQGGTGVVAEQPVIYETLPKVDPITIVTTTGADGWWVAYGY